MLHASIAIEILRLLTISLAEPGYLVEFHPMLRHARRIVVLVVGMTVLLTGVALIVLPGPAFVVIPIGLAILATEFAWARRWLQHVHDTVDKAAGKLNLRTLFSRRRWNGKCEPGSK
jgi:uncharacterized protein (TIGR02611 family)